MLAANDGEVAAGNLANARSMNSAVRTFAAMMVTDHTMANQTLATTLVAQGIAPADSPTRQMLTTQATQTLNTLFAAPTTSFDAAYVDSQIAMHMMVRDLLDGAIPMAMNAALKTQAQTMRAAVVAHLTAAQQLRASLTGADGGTDGATDGGTDGATDAATDAAATGG